MTVILNRWSAFAASYWIKYIWIQWGIFRLLWLWNKTIN